MQVRVRFAPSPTGYLHIGNVHTALFNWLFARRQGGTFILRMEDTDVERSSAVYEEAICKELSWLGLDWDEGIGKGGDYGPYRQSERGTLYQAYAEKLLQSGHAYWCYCSLEELEQERQRALAQGEAPRYSGRCLGLSAAEKAAFVREGRKPVLRFHVPEDRNITTSDLIRGEITFQSATIGDFIIVRANGVPTYNFAVTIDDVTMGITHVIRADEHISNTPRQLLIYEALNLPQPLFAHVSMLLGPDRTKLSKRHGAAAVTEYQKLGYLPKALVNYLSLLGWTPPGGEEILSTQEILSQFDLTRVGKSASVFDQTKLNWVNSQYLRRLPLAEFTQLAIPHLVEAGLITQAEAETQREWLEQLLALFQEQISYLAELKTALTFFFHPPTYDQPELSKVLRQPRVEEMLTRFGAKIEELNPFDEGSVHTLLHTLPEELGLGRGKVLRPLRAALTGQLSGPELNRAVAVLGRKECQVRLRAALAWLKG